MRPGELATVGLLAIGAVSVNAQIPASAYPARRAAAMARIGGAVLVVPAREVETAMTSGRGSR